jgi:ABC-2 type transport system ATP-binding protein
VVIVRISLRGISKKYKAKDALIDVTIELENGVYGLLGENGAGKTTLINIFVGILRADAGRVLIDGTDVRELGLNFLSKIGYLPQSPQFYRSFEVIEFLKYICALKNIPKRTGEKRALELLETVNLKDDAHKKIGALSGGMRQRVGIVQAMLNDPDILILDEPTAGLDPQERIRFRNLISKFSENRVVILATHIVTDVEFIANQVILLKKGRLLKHDSPAALSKGIKGKVWTISETNHALSDSVKLLKISNMQRDGERVHLRVISDECPVSGASETDANLEDVFLYYCGEGEQW